jgi:transposase
MYYIGLDIHKKTISFCVKTADGTILEQGKIDARRETLEHWAARMPRPNSVAMEATMFTSWVYDFLVPRMDQVRVAHPAMLHAITAAKRKNDPLDASKITDLLRANLLPEAYMTPASIREQRTRLRFRTLVVRQTVQTKNRISGLLMEAGVEYNQGKLHQKAYFSQLLKDNTDLPEGLWSLLKLARNGVEFLNKMDRGLVQAIRKDALLKERIERLLTIPGVGPITALTWALEVGEIERFPNLAHAISYCGLCSAENNSAGIARRGPISKQRNHFLQTVLVEAAKLAPRWNPELARVYNEAKEKGNCNRATLAVARKLVAYLLAVDKRKTPFVREGAATAAA